MDFGTLLIAAAVLAAILLMARWRKAHLRHRESPLGQAESTYVRIEVIDERQDKVSTTYRAGYELITRRLRLMLEMLEVYQEKGSFGIGDGDLAPRPTVTSRVSYMSEAFAPHLRSIRNLDDFAKYAPYREGHQFVLSVHPDDLEEAYQVLRDMKIRLSAMHHPDQHWWRDDEETV